MTTLQLKADEIRELINAYPLKEELLKDSLKWHKLCSSLDTLEDTDFAIEFFNNITTFDGMNGAGYLYIHGLLQALYLQQDSLDSLSRALLGVGIKWEKDYPDTYEVRELRNDITGHPTERNKDSRFHVLSRVTINERGFQVLDYFPSADTVFRDIKIKDYIDKQKKDVLSIVEHIRLEVSKL